MSNHTKPIESRSSKKQKEMAGKGREGLPNVNMLFKDDQWATSSRNIWRAAWSGSTFFIFFILSVISRLNL